MNNTFRIITLGLVLLLIQSCNKNDKIFDATGTFEATETIISAETNGKIISFPAEEGSDVLKDAVVAQIETEDIQLQIDQIEATMNALNMKKNDATPQIEILNEQKKAIESNLNTIKTQMSVIAKEKTRLTSLLDDGAATPKQLDDINGQLEIIQSNLTSASSQLNVIDAQIKAAKKNVDLQNRSITSEKDPLAKKVLIMESQLKKATITSPINGTILSKYAEEGEFITMGRPIFKIADMSELILRAYISGPQLGKIKIGQQVNVLVDEMDGYKKYIGTISWISNKAEFTPKSIQTKDERANLVYAIKIIVPNDGFLKLGMYGEVEFSQSQQ